MEYDLGSHALFEWDNYFVSYMFSMFNKNGLQTLLKLPKQSRRLVLFPILRRWWLPTRQR
jgi:hypothetical protein